MFLVIQRTIEVSCCHIVFDTDLIFCDPNSEL